MMNKKTDKTRQARGKYTKKQEKRKITKFNKFVNL